MKIFSATTVLLEVAVMMICLLDTAVQVQAAEVQGEVQGEVQVEAQVDVLAEDSDRVNSRFII